MGIMMLVLMVGCEPWVEVDGVKWAIYNVGDSGKFVDDPTKGLFYQWGRDIGWDKNGNHYPNSPVIQWDTTKAGGDWNNGKAVCPKGWRLPNISEIQKLIASGSFEGKLNGVEGTFFIGKENKRLFFPFGTLNPTDGSPAHTKTYGNIWGSYEKDENNHWQIYNMGNHHGTAGWSTGANRANGHYVRCVCEEDTNK